MHKKILLLSLAVLALAIPGSTLAQTATGNKPTTLPRATTVSPQASPAVSPLTVTNEGTKNLTTKNTPDILSNLKDSKAKLESYKIANETQKLERLKSLGADLIENRIASLNNLKTRINSMTKTSEASKTATLTEVEKNIADLTTLGAKIQADTDLITLKADVKSIYETYRVYAVVLPQNLGLSAASRGQYILGQLSALEVKLQKIIAQNKNSGKDVSAIEKLILDFEAKIMDAKSQLQIAETQFKSMTPANAEVAKTSREAGMAAMKQAKDSLKAAHDIIKNIIDQLKLVSKPVITPSTTITPIPSTSVSPTPLVSPIKSPTIVITPSN